MRPKNAFLTQYFQDHPKATTAEAAEASGLHVNTVRNFLNGGKGRKKSGGLKIRKGKRSVSVRSGTAQDLRVLVGNRALNVSTLQKIGEAVKAITQDIGSDDPRCIRNTLLATCDTLKKLK